MRFLVPWVAALVPLLITPGLLAYFDVTPKIAFLLFGAALILLYSAQNIRNLSAILHFKPGRWWVLLLGAQWLSSAIAAAFSTHPALSLNGSSWRRYGLVSETGLLIFVLLAGAWLAADRRNLVTLLRASTAAGALAALYGIAQYFGWDPLLPAQAYQAGEGPFTIVRPPGTLGHADYFAAWLLTIVFFSLALERMEQARWRKVTALAAAALASFAIVLSGTRSALLGLLIGAIVFVIAGRPRIRIGVIALVLAALCVFFFSPPGAKLRARLHWSIDDVRGGARLLLWRDSLQMAAHRPIAGFGPESFITEFPRFESIELARAYPDFYHESPHNIFLDAFTSRGLIGLLPWFALTALGAWAAFQLVKRGDDLGAPLAAGIAASLVCQQFIVLIVPTALYFYLLLVTSVMTWRTHSCVPRSHSCERKAITTTTLASIAIAILLSLFAIRLVATDAAIAVTDRRIASGDAKGAARVYKTVQRWQPSGTGSDLRYSRAMHQLSLRAPVFADSLLARQEAIQAGIAATRTSEDRENAWYNLATLLAANNDVTGVERSLRNTLAWAPNWFKPHWTLAQLLEMTHRHGQALQEARVAVDLDAGHDPEVTETLKQFERVHPAH